MEEQKQLDNLDRATEKALKTNRKRKKEEKKRLYF